MDLPKSITSDSIEYNFIFILIDRFIKLVCYYLVHKIIDATRLIKLLFRIFMQIGPLDNIIFNKGSVFTSKYWSTIYYYFCVLHKLSIAFYP